jgi:uncharacterized protein YacL
MDTLLFAVIAVIIFTGLLGFTRIARLNIKNLLVLVAGGTAGALIGALMSIPLGSLPPPYGSVLPIVVSLLSIAGMLKVFYDQRESLNNLLPAGKVVSHRSTGGSNDRRILVDTSVIIDGRIADIAKAGFVPGKLLVPRFVLAELQNIADSDDQMRRSRGRRGLEMLNNIQGTPGIDLEIIEDEVPGVKEVDAKLVALAQRLDTNILTTDYNLNRVAQIEGVRVLNINELSNAIRPVVLPGEEMPVKIVQAGKERNQGVGYLPDGTMIVVENGDKLIGQEMNVEVTRVFQTVAGKMIFAILKKPALAQNGGNGKAVKLRGPRRPARASGESQKPGDIEDRLLKQNQQS